MRFISDLNGIANGKSETNGVSVTNGKAETNGTSNVLKAEVTEVTNILYNPEDFKPYDPSQELIFPPELKV